MKKGIYYLPLFFLTLLTITGSIMLGNWLSSLGWGMALLMLGEVYYLRFFEMKKFSLIIGLILLTGCKSSKQSCDAYSYEIKVEHCHIDEESYCYYTVDTIRLTK